MILIRILGSRKHRYHPHKLDQEVNDRALSWKAQSISLMPGHTLLSFSTNCSTNNQLGDKPHGDKMFHHQPPLDLAIYKSYSASKIYPSSMTSVAT